jgi:transposase InsO family protein
VFGRQLLVARVAAGWPAATVAEQLGISRATAYKWLRRHRKEGPIGLLDRSSRPRRSPRQLSTAAEAEILAARSAWRYGPDRLGPLLGRPASTVHRVLVRRGFSRLRDTDRVTTAPVRYVACHPGALIHQDHKKLGRIPEGGGWRADGRSTEARRRQRQAGPAYEQLEVLVDDASRYAVVVAVPDETAASAITALETAAAEFARVGIRIERVLTDNGTAYKAQFDAAVARLGARHKRTRPYRPQTNGKAERFIKTLLAEWAYGRTYRSGRERAAALPGFIDFYNRRRPHTAIGGRSPLDVVNNVLGDHT